LKDAETQGRLKKGMTVLLAGFGIGFSWAGTVIKI
ncbi:MAG: ketoacyl-ACP synthase III, partial [Bacteroidetes bacterium]|nr:ketoacyl-ACP synthase III [Bacteroidota bacterium]